MLNCSGIVNAIACKIAKSFGVKDTILNIFIIGVRVQFVRSGIINGVTCKIGNFWG